MITASLLYSMNIPIALIIVNSMVSKINREVLMWIIIYFDKDDLWFCSLLANIENNQSVPVSKAESQCFQQISAMVCVCHF